MAGDASCSLRLPPSADSDGNAVRACSATVTCSETRSASRSSGSSTWPTASLRCGACPGGNIRMLPNRSDVSTAVRTGALTREANMTPSPRRGSQLTRCARSRRPRGADAPARPSRASRIRGHRSIDAPMPSSTPAAGRRCWIRRAPGSAPRRRSRPAAGRSDGPPSDDRKPAHDSADKPLSSADYRQGGGKYRREIIRRPHQAARMQERLGIHPRVSRVAGAAPVPAVVGVSPSAGRGVARFVARPTPVQSAPQGAAVPRNADSPGHRAEPDGVKR